LQSFVVFLSHTRHIGQLSTNARWALGETVQNHRHRIMFVAAALVAAGSLLEAAPAQDRGSAEAIVERLAACREIDDSMPRLACFDTSVANLISARDEKELVVLDRDDVRTAKRKLFGFSLPQIKLFGGADGDDENGIEPEVKEIESSITEARDIGAAKWLFILADGTAWQTTEASSRIFPRKGDPIRIEAALLGSYKATIDGRATVRVKRIR
jgi:hypothetical protein